MSLQDKMDAVYRDMAPSEIPWNLEKPPAVLLDFVSIQSFPCVAVDLGCGAGNYAVWLADMGFQITGIDLSSEAIRIAKRHARAKGVECRFRAGDLLSDALIFEDPFDLAYDWEVLHHVPPARRPLYVQNVHALLRPGGRYLSVSFAVEDPAFGGQGKVRETPLGTTLHFSEPEDLRRLFEPLFEIERLSTEEIPAKSGFHIAVVARLKARHST